MDAVVDMAEDAAAVVNVGVDAAVEVALALLLVPPIPHVRRQ